MNVQPIQAIEEVNMFKSDGNVIHFSAPKGESLPFFSVSRPRFLLVIWRAIGWGLEADMCKGWARSKRGRINAHGEED